MSRIAQPFFRKSRKAWYVQLGTRQVRLGPDKEAAFRKYHEVMAHRDDPVPEVDASLVAELVDAYLEWCKIHRAPGTYEWYVNHLSGFVNSLPDAASFPVAKLLPFHVTRWIDGNPDWGNNYRRGAISATQRCFVWAEQQGLLTRNPLRFVEKPAATPRDLVVSETQFRTILSSVRDNPFRQLLEFCWETGTRPQEVRIIEAGHFSPEKCWIALPPSIAKGKKRWRIIYLTGKALAIVQGLMKVHPKGILFRNTEGKPWSRFSIGCRMARLRSKTGFRFCLTNLRHTFANRMLTGGCDSLTVSALLGHKDGTTLAKVYSHLGQFNGHLQDQLTKASNAGAAVPSDA